LNVVGGQLATDSRVGDFRICTFIGEGSVGEVYLAHDMVLGRRVALKLLKHDVVDAATLARFREEARATASFNHPHIVTLHRYGEHEGRPYLALEHVDGESLRVRLQRGPMPLHEALRCARSIAAALAEAHRSGIVHADLKPENVMIGRDGRVRVLDFGLARLVGAAGRAASGTPAYMSPERWSNTDPSGAMDIWSLGLILGEMITGARPFSDAELPKLAFVTLAPRLPEEPWAEIARACVDRAVASRPTAEQVIDRLTKLLERPIAVDEPAAAPYPGLASFTREQAAGYFGRAAEVDAIVEHLRTEPLVPVSGPSGIGKTSFARAAVLPRLQQSRPWIAIEWRPGPDPFGALSAALARYGCSVPGVVLREKPETLSLRLREVAQANKAHVLLVLDQAEELFTLGSIDAEVMCECLARAAFADEPWRMILTIRDDYLGMLARSNTMRSHLGAVFPLSPMNAHELRLAVTGPLTSVGYNIDSTELPDQIVSDVIDRPACLPLLQFACASLWERRDRDKRLVLASEYAAFGGATGALATHAERCLTELGVDEVRIVRQLFLSLITTDRTRRPRMREDLLEGLPPVAEKLLDRLLQRRLLVATGDNETGGTLVEVAHEAIATTWPRLARWLDETHEERILTADIEQAATLWQRRGRRDAETWTGPTLAEVVRKIEAWNLDLRSNARAFIDAGRQHAARMRRRRRWFAVVILAALAVAAIGATVAAIVIARSKRDAELRAATERVVAADRGVFELELVPFDWDVKTLQTHAPATQPTLFWTLSDPEGREYAGDDIVRGRPERVGSEQIERVEARSGPAILTINRGECPPSIISLRRLPGYHERGRETTIRIDVPTCEASRADMRKIPAGEFMRNVDTDNSGHFRDERYELPAFAMDRTEVTRGAFAVYERMVGFTGESAAPAPHMNFDKLGGASLPIVGVNFETARAYCRFLGKDLPTIEQWQKAVRGGLMLPTGPNPAPTREAPWVVLKNPRPTNASFGDDAAIQPVGSVEDDVSPYGIVDLAGNVLEWTLSQPPATSPLRDLRNVAGTSWDAPFELGQYKVQWRNNRFDRYLDFGLGLRCVSGE
jgi:formylglycine-generating enzyme required for sulfatase activity/tRNA A-37 threonylcarbamoyl transferase component Bud32